MPRSLSATTRARHIHDGVHRADVVELDRLPRRAVHPRLGIGQPREDARGLGLDVAVELAPTKDGQDVDQPAMGVMGALVDLHLDLEGAEVALHDVATGQRPAGQAELGQLALQGLERGAGIDERGHDHVARGAARAVEVGEPHGYALDARWLIWLAWWAAP